MANKRTRSRKSSNSRTKSRRRKQHGGTAEGPAPPSAWGHAMNTVGDGWKQFATCGVKGVNEIATVVKDLVWFDI